jgi:hypothetical protein
MDLQTNVQFFLYLFFLIKCFNYYDKKLNLREFIQSLINKGIILVVYYTKNEKGEKMKEDNKEKKEKQIVEKKAIKYEDKYLEEFRKMPKEYIFTDEEIKMADELYPDFFQKALTKIYNLKQDLKLNLKEKQNELNDIIDIDMVNDSSEEENNNKNNVIEELLKKEIGELNDKLEALNIQNITKEEIDLEVNNCIIQKRLDNLKTCFIIEKTPLGNVIMIYNNKNSSFQYYSDSTIPYRYLEPVGRKYVITFRCRSIYVDMDEELKEYERKIDELEKEKKEREIMEKAELDKEKKEKMPVKKNVFAKFKDYNKEAGSGRVNMAPPPKNSIPSRVKNDAKLNEKVILKDNANRYTCEGRFSNFNIIQKVDRKKVDKKYAMTFADFKKMNKDVKPSHSPSPSVV